MQTKLILSLILALCASPQVSFAQPVSYPRISVFGSAEVRLEGYNGVRAVRRGGLKINVAGTEVVARSDGFFFIDDINIITPAVMAGQQQVYFSEPKLNEVVMLEGREKVRLPVTWRGQIYNNVLVLQGQMCSISADGSYGCYQTNRTARELYDQCAAAGLCMPISTPPPPPTAQAPGAPVSSPGMTVGPGGAAVQMMPMAPPAMPQAVGPDADSIPVLGRPVMSAPAPAPVARPQVLEPVDPDVIQTTEPLD